MRLHLCVFLICIFPTVVIPQTAKNDSQAIDAGNESNVNLGKTQITAGGDVTIQYPQTAYLRDLERKVARLQLELEEEKASAGAAQKGYLDKRRELDDTRSKLADIESSYQQKLRELNDLQKLLANLGPEADQERVELAQLALVKGDTVAAIALANSLRDDKAGDVDAAATAEFILGAALETDLQWVEADAHYRRAAEIDPNAERLAKACALAVQVDDLLRAQRYCSDRIEHLREKNRHSNPDLVKALADLAEIEGKLGRVSSALEHFGPAIAIGKSLEGDEGKLIHAENLARYAEFLIPLGKIREAEESALEALSITEKILGADHRDVADRLWVLGNIYSHFSKIEKAEAVYRRGLDVTQTSLGKVHPDYATRLIDFADVSFSARSTDSKTATAMVAEGLSLVKQAFGPDHFEYGRALRKNAGFLWASGQPKQGLETAEKALDIIKVSRGEASADYVYALHAVAAFAIGVGNYEYSKNQFVKALEAAQQTYGNESYIVGVTYVRLGSAYFQLRDFENAEESHRRARAIFRVVVGENSPDFANASLGLSTVMRDTGRLLEAAELARTAFETQRNLLGESNVLFALSAASLASIYAALGKSEDAVDLAETVRTAELNAWGRPTQLWAAATQTLGMAHMEKGEYGAGAELLRAALEVFESNGSNTSHAFFTNKFNLTTALAFDGKADEAIEIAEELKAFAKTEYKAAHPNHGLAHRVAGIAYNEAGRYDDAEREYRAAISILEDLGEAEATHRVLSMVGLSQVLSKQRRSQDAAFTMHRAADVAQEIFGPEHKYSFGLQLQAAAAFVRIAKYDEAEEILSDLKTRSEEYLGRLSDEYWQGVNFQAWLERSRGVTDTSVTIHDQRLALAIEKFGETSEQRIVSLKLLADVHKELGALDEAKRYSAEALDLAHRYLPKGHDEIGNLMLLQSNLARQSGDFAGSAEHAKRAVVFARENAEERPADLVDKLNFYGDVLSEIEENDAARAAYEEAVDLAQDLDADGAYKAGAAITDLGHLASKLGDLRSAERHFEDAFEIMKDLGDLEHDAYPVSLQNLASNKLRMNEIEEAREMYAELVSLAKERHGADSVQYAQALQSRGLVSLRANDLTAAETDMNRALKLLVDASASQDTLEDAEAVKTDLLIAKGRVDEAVSILNAHSAVVEETDSALRFNSYDARDKLLWLKLENGDVSSAETLAAEQLTSLESVGLTKGWYFLSALSLQSVLATLEKDKVKAEELLAQVTELANTRYETETSHRLIVDEARMYVGYAFGDAARASIDRALLEDKANRLLGVVNPDRKRLQGRIDFVLGQIASQ